MKSNCNYALKDWVDLIKDSVAYTATEHGIDTQSFFVSYCRSLSVYDKEMKKISLKFGIAPGRLQYRGSAFTFYYKGVEVIYLPPWERTNKSSKAYLDTKYGYMFDDFYDYVKFRFAKDNYVK